MPECVTLECQVLFAKMKDGKLRLYIDFKQVNKVVVKKTYTLPRIGYLFDQLRGVKVLSKINLRSRYYQVRIMEEDINGIAFRTWYGNYDSTLVPFGLSNALGVFMFLINEFSKFIWLSLLFISIWNPWLLKILRRRWATFECCKYSESITLW